MYNNTWTTLRKNWQSDKNRTLHLCRRHQCMHPFIDYYGFGKSCTGFLCGASRTLLRLIGGKRPVLNINKHSLNTSSNNFHVCNALSSVV